MLFTELNLPPEMQRGLDEANYITCMPVQEKVFAQSFSGEDIYAQSQTGSGKTAAFLISIFQRILTVPELRNKKALILAPTRELAVQIEEEAEMLGKYLDISSGAFYGGVGYGPQVDMLKADVQLIIGTPGRITDLIQQGKMMLNEVGFLVIDEADRMFDMGFIDDLRRLLRYLPPASRRQTFLFSATLGLRVKDLAWEYMRSPKEITIESEQVTVDLVTQELYHVGSHEKFSLLLGILARDEPGSAIIFCNQKNMAEEVSRRLRVNGVESEFIMGDLPQAKRLAVINKLKEGKLRILVATDVAARGLDVDSLDLVINYDVPNEPESYVHRIGRTARAGKSGKAVTLACEKFVYGLPAVEKFLGARIPVLPYGESLLPEDKSARIQYRHAHERGGPETRRRHDDRRDPRPASRDHARLPARPLARPEARPAARLTDAVRPPVSQPRDQTNREPLADRSGRKNGTPAQGNPYSVSQDERMRQYRQKYATGQPESEPETEKRAPGNDRPRQSPARNDRPAVSSNAPKSPSAPEASGSGGAPRSAPQAPRPLQPQARPPVQAPAAAQAPKPGLLDRIRGLFGGKKKD